jgi:hypothetical protein
MKQNRKRAVTINQNPRSKAAFFVVAVIAALLLPAHFPQTVLAQRDYGHYGGVIPMNRLIGGTITNETHFIEYTFSGKRGQEVFITLQAAGYGNLDPYLSLRGPDSTTLDTDDDGWTGRNSKIEITLPQDGAYTVTATRCGGYDGLSVGNFLLWVTDSHPRVAYYGVFSPNQYIIGAISDEYYGVEHTFSGRAGEEITITMKKFKGTLDPYLSLRGPDSTTLDTDDDGWTGRNSKIEITLPQDGAYTVTATRCGGYDGTTSGQYILRILSDTHPTGGVLHPDQIIMGYIGKDLNSATYSFDYTGALSGGVNVAVGTQSSRQYPDLDLYDSNDNPLDIFFYASSASRFAMLARTHMPQTGTYYIRVKVSRKGYYTITLRHPAYAR